MKKYRWIIWLVVIAALAFGVWYWKFKPAAVQLVLETEHPGYGTIANSVTATGTLQPVDTVAVGTQISGVIQKVYVDFNTVVKKGQLLAEIDKSLLLAQVSQIAANLQSARANIDFQKSNYDRQNQLYNVGAISKAELETALNQYKSANASIANLNAQLSAANKSLSYAEIYSPIDGTVLSRAVSEGQTVAASLSTPTLFSIAKDLTKMQVQAAVDEADIGNVKIGQRVIFTVDAFPSDTFAGTVKEIRLRPAVSSNVVTYTTIIDAPNDQRKLMPGMTASISIYTQEVKNILLVSAKAIQFRPDSTLAKKFFIVQRTGGGGGGNRRQGGSGSGKQPMDSGRRQPRPTPPDSVGSVKLTRAFVWLKRGDSIVAHPVMTGLDDDTHVQVVHGLTTNDEVVTGYSELNKSSKKASTAKSPFLPQRPGGNNNRRRPNGP